MRKYTPQERIDVFWSKVAITADDDKCWLWLAGKTDEGYGNFHVYRKPEKAHRIAWMYPDYIIPDGMKICHSCDNPKCCNPKHLFIGTDKDNNHDMIRKGRARHIKGEQHYMCKLTDAQVIEIRQRYAAGGITQKQLGIEYGADQTYIGDIVNLKNRKL